MRHHLSLIALALNLMAAGLMAQNDSTAAQEPGIKSTIDSNAVKMPAPVSAPPALIDSGNEYNLLELYYYGPDYEGMYDIFDPWDVYPDQEGDSRERDNDSRDSQERDAREE